MWSRRLFYRSFLVLALLVGGVGCELTEDEKAALDGIIDEDQSPGGEFDYDPLKPNCYGQTYRQPEAEISKKVDLLFVVDTSGSLDQEREDIAQGVDAFLSALPADVDVNIGVNMAHVGAWSGKLYRKSSTQPLVLKSSLQTMGEIKSQLTHRMRYTVSEWDSDGGEAGLFSLNRMLEEDRIAEARNEGMFREDAALVVVFVADENDICAEYPAGVTPVYDGDRLEAPAKARYCSGISPEGVLQKLKLFMADRPAIVSGIIYHEGSVFSHTGENEIAYGYKEMIEMSNGAMIDLAGGHYNVGLESIAKLAVKKLNLKTEFQLSTSNVDADSLKVKVDNTDVPFAYNEINSTVMLTEEAGRENSEIYIAYCEPPKEDELPAPEISNLRASLIDAAGATITWDTDIPASSQLEVTHVASGAKVLTNLVTHEVLSHVIVLKGLNPDTLYGIRAISKTNNKETISTEIKFKTTRSLN